MPIYKMNGKKNGKQKYRVRINYIDSYGQAKQIDRVAYGNEEAKQLERELNYQIKQQTPAQRMSVKELFEEYKKAKKYEVRESTYSKTDFILSHYIIPELSNVKIDKLTVPILQKWKHCIEEMDISIRTRKSIYSEFRTLLNWAVKMEYIPSNPLLKVGNFKAPMEIEKEMDYYTADEFKKFITAALINAQKASERGDCYQWHYYVFFAVAFYTGMRKGEIHALTWNDYKDGYISITKSLTQKLKGGDRITPPKNKSSVRTIQVPLPLKKILDEHYDRCKEIDGFSNDLYICGGLKPLRDTTLENANIKFANEAGIKKIRIHDFRHSHASLLANEGINIQEVARRLGHSNVTITWQTYSHLYPKEEERAIAVLNKVI